VTVYIYIHPFLPQKHAIANKVNKSTWCYKDLPLDLHIWNV